MSNELIANYLRRSLVLPEFVSLMLIGSDETITSENGRCSFPWTLPRKADNHYEINIPPNDAGFQILLLSLPCRVGGCLLLIAPRSEVKLPAWQRSCKRAQ
jgi:hypothetical protein